MTSADDRSAHIDLDAECTIVGVSDTGNSLCGRLAAFFEKRPGEWQDGRTLSGIAGTYAWRTRVSDLRRPPYNLTIENRQRRQGRFVVSEYRMVPKVRTE